MPVEWMTSPQKAPAPAGAFLPSGDTPPLAVAHLWPNRSLPRRGFAWVIGFMFTMILIPVIPLLGTPVLWGLLPFVMGALWLLWGAIMRNYRDGEVREVLSLWPDRLLLSRREPRRAEPLEWEANPHWVKVVMHEKGGPVSHYVTLRGSGREVEIGAFLSPDERKALYAELTSRLGG
ncbi:DUF2244 domain-containing protein [Profundibacterium mesophilum]|uniref:Integral membrane protein domain containing protein n=1 Tax=Profundibacterium mesophilum KAUST100406-0324 TaxID=1037889 RepID=A0A921NZA8_9RHOB|nr:DUF2244 domain-containing protein [Profundibacterium mesophilum]KAF0676268.1 Integral membrane protein domain containing protein [Profundibacterium mesophilum KAUST100406-0324]